MQATWYLPNSQLEIHGNSVSRFLYPSLCMQILRDLRDPEHSKKYCECRKSWLHAVKINENFSRRDSISYPIFSGSVYIITQSGLFENEIGPGVLQSSVQQTRVLEEYYKAQTMWNWLCVVSVLILWIIYTLHVCPTLGWNIPGPTSFSKHLRILFLECSIQVLFLLCSSGK